MTTTMRVPAEEIVKETTNKQVELYICPTPGCQSAVVAPPGEKLEESWTGVKTEDRGALAVKSGSPWRHTRAECPECRIAGLGRVMRVRVSTVVQVPKVGPTPPPLPAPTGKMAPIGTGPST